MIYQALYAGVIYPLYHWALRDGANAAIREFDQNETVDADTLDAIVERKRQSLVRFAADHVPYYRKLFADLGIDGDAAVERASFDRLPLLTKADINANLDSMVAERLEGNRLDPNSTGGSTGEVLRLYTDARSGACRKAAVRRNKRWVGIRPGDREVRLWGAPLDLRKANSLRGRLHSMITCERLLSADRLGDDSLREYLEFCKSFQPKLMVAYPSALAEFARYCADRNSTIDSLEAIICSAESLLPHDRELIESVFGVRVYDRYGCREVGDIAQEAPGVTGLMVNSDRIFVEVLDEDGRPSAPGEQGEIVVTDLDNYGMPLLRYRIADYGRWGNREEAIAAGFPFPVLASVDGRVMDVVHCPGGQRVGGTYWTLLLRSRPGLVKFQIVQKEPDRVEVLYEKEAGVEPDFAYYRQEIAKNCGPELNVDFVETSRFVHEPGTKFRLVIRET